jgi:hypothetical protein
MKGRREFQEERTEEKASDMPKLLCFRQNQAAKYLQRKREGKMVNEVVASVRIAVVMRRAR